MNVGGLGKRPFSKKGTAPLEQEWVMSREENPKCPRPQGQWPFTRPSHGPHSLSVACHRPSSCMLCSLAEAQVREGFQLLPAHLA